MKIKLYGRPFNRTDRVQWTLEELELTYEYRKLDVFAREHRGDEFRSKYGLTRLPFVELDGEVLFESGAIMLHLAETFRERKDLLASVATTARAEIYQWVFFGLSTLEAADAALGVDDEPAPAASLQEVLGFLERHLKGREYFAASRFTLADIAIATGLQWFDRALLRGRPALENYLVRMNARAGRRRVTSQVEHPSEVVAG
ncbi:MAG: glutathione S-transferase [Polyangiales bacterium]|jgi:glutathione S-transferase